MGVYEYMIMALTSVGVFCFGVWFGRRLERYEIYLRLLSSRDPQSWTVAHKLHRDKHPPMQDEDSDNYNPTHGPSALDKKRSAKDHTTVKVKKIRNGGSSPFPD